MILFRTFLFLLILWSLDLQADPKICVTVTVKNNESVIYSFLNSIKNVADYLVVSASPCKDDTLNILEEFQKSASIPMHVQLHQDEPTRAESVQEAKKTLQDWGVSLSDVYLLILNPDMVIKFGAGFRKNELTEDAYSLLTRFSALDYFAHDQRLMKASLSWAFSNHLYEWVSLNEAKRLTSLWIEDQEKSAKSKEALENKLDLLEQETSPLALFYRGLIYKKLKRYEEAIQAFSSCIEKGGDSEQVWFSKYMIADCYQELSQWGQALYWYLEAFQYKSDYAEPLWKISYHYRMIGKNDLAFLFAKHGMRIPPSQQQRFFHSNPLTSYQFDEELSIASYYTRFKEEGKVSANHTLLNQTAPWWVKDQTYRNLLFYETALPDARYVPIEIDLPPIEEGHEERYRPMNPSIKKTQKGYEVICRAVNYTQKGAKEFHTLDSQGIYRTRNFLLEYGPDFHLLSQREILDHLDRERLYSCSVEGLEDCRIFDWQGSRWFTCTTSDTNPTGQRQISLCQLSDQVTRDAVYLKSLLPLHGPDPYRCEKNWLPFIKNGKLHLIYSCHPFTIFQADLETGKCETLLQYETKHDLSRFRGSAGPIPFDGGYLMLVHEVVPHENFERTYLHRFLYLDQEMRVQKLSHPFTYRHLGIEFCCSMTADHRERELIMTIGIEDREAYLCFLSLESIRSLLKPLPEIYEPLFK